MSGLDGGCFNPSKAHLPQESTSKENGGPYNTETPLRNKDGTNNIQS